MQKFENKFAISCDWLQIHVKAPDNFLELENPYYSFRRTGQSKIWRNIYEVKNTALDLKIGEYCTDAQECIMKKGHGVLKLENNQLYCHENLQVFVETLLHRLRMKFISITRLDIALDFQKFYMEYDPMKLIKRYAEHKILRLGSSKKTSSIMFQQNNRYHDFQTLYFGSKKSDVQIKMYNKTIELQHISKPYITSLHRDTFQNDRNVWRLEFSIYSLSKAMLENADGIKMNYNSLDVLNIKNLYGIFIGLFEKHFQFRTCGKEKRIARMKPIQLWIFDLDCTKLELKKKNELIKISSQAHKIFLKRLNEASEKLCPDDIEKQNKVLLFAAKEFNVKNYDKCEDEKEKNERFCNEIRKKVKSDRSAKMTINKLNSFIHKRDYDQNACDAVKEIIGKFVSEYQLQEYAIKKDILYKDYENYIFEVEQFKRITANEEKLDIDFKKMIEAANVITQHHIKLENGIYEKRKEII